MPGNEGLESITTTTTDHTGQRQASADGDAKWWTLAAVCIGTFMLLLDITIVNVALPDIQGELKASFSDLQWVVDAYALTLASLLLTTGSIADLFGRRLLFMIGVVLFTGASALCGAATGSLMLEISRGLQGVGGAIMFSVSLALLANAFRGKDRGVAFGVWGMATGTAVGVGPVLGGALVTLSWRWIFFVNIPVGIVALAITWWKVAESKQAGARRPDWAGFVVFTAALALLVYALIESGRTSFSDTTVIACFAAGGALMVVFLIVELRGDQPMLDLSLFRLPTFTGGAIAAFAVSSGIFSMLLYLVLYLENVLGFSALGAGTRLLLISGGTFITSAITGRSDRVRADSAVGRPRAGLDRYRVAAHARYRRHLVVDSSDPGLHRLRSRHRDDESALGRDGRGCRPARACRDGVGDQLDIPSARDRDRDRPARDAARLEAARRHHRRPGGYATGGPQRFDHRCGESRRFQGYCAQPAAGSGDARGSRRQGRICGLAQLHLVGRRDHGARQCRSCAGSDPEQGLHPARRTERTGPVAVRFPGRVGQRPGLPRHRPGVVRPACRGTAGIRPPSTVGRSGIPGRCRIPRSRAVGTARFLRCPSATVSSPSVLPSWTNVCTSARASPDSPSAETNARSIFNVSTGNSRR